MMSQGVQLVCLGTGTADLEVRAANIHFGVLLVNQPCGQSVARPGQCKVPLCGSGLDSWSRGKVVTQLGH